MKLTKIDKELAKKYFKIIGLDYVINSRILIPYFYIDTFDIYLDLVKTKVKNSYVFEVRPAIYESEKRLSYDNPHFLVFENILKLTESSGVQSAILKAELFMNSEKRLNKIMKRFEFFVSWQHPESLYTIATEHEDFVMRKIAINKMTTYEDLEEIVISYRNHDLKRVAYDKIVNEFSNHKKTQELVQKWIPKTTQTEIEILIVLFRNGYYNSKQLQIMIGDYDIKGELISLQRKGYIEKFYMNVSKENMYDITEDGNYYLDKWYNLGKIIENKKKPICDICGSDMEKYILDMGKCVECGAKKDHLF